MISIYGDNLILRYLKEYFYNCKIKTGTNGYSTAIIIMY